MQLRPLPCLRVAVYHSVTIVTNITEMFRWLGLSVWTCSTNVIYFSTIVFALLLIEEILVKSICLNY